MIDILYLGILKMNHPLAAIILESLKYNISDITNKSYEIVGCWFVNTIR